MLQLQSTYLHNFLSCINMQEVPLTILLFLACCWNVTKVRRAFLLVCQTPHDLLSVRIVKCSRRAQCSLCEYRVLQKRRQQCMNVACIYTLSYRDFVKAKSILHIAYAVLQMNKLATMCFVNTDSCTKLFEMSWLLLMLQWHVWLITSRMLTGWGSHVT